MDDFRAIGQNLLQQVLSGHEIYQVHKTNMNFYLETESRKEASMAFAKIRKGKYGRDSLDTWKVKVKVKVEK